MKVIISEQQYEKIILEFFKPEKLYDREDIVRRLSRAPREIKKLIKDLPYIDCEDTERNISTVCTKIPEVIYVYLTSRY